MWELEVCIPSPVAGEGIASVGGDWDMHYWESLI